MQRHAAVANLNKGAKDHIKVKTFRQKQCNNMKALVGNMFAPDSPDFTFYLSSTFWGKTMGGMSNAQMVCKAFSIKRHAGAIGKFLLEDRYTTQPNS